MGTEFKVGAGLACVGLAVAISAWLIPPESISYGVRFSLVLLAITFAIVGICLISHSAWVYYHEKSMANRNSHLELTDKQLANLLYPKETWLQKVFRPTKVHESKLIQLSEAASKLYEAAKQGRIPIVEAETLSGGMRPSIHAGLPEDILNWWSIKISQSDISLYGRRYPYNQLEKIPSSHRKYFIFKDGGKTFHDPVDDSIFYYDLHVKQIEFEQHYDIQAAYYGE